MSNRNRVIDRAGSSADRELIGWLVDVLRGQDSIASIHIARDRVTVKTSMSDEEWDDVLERLGMGPTAHDDILEADDDA